jgi:U4/U6.U5 tri-snRNP component SNU23
LSFFALTDLDARIEARQREEDEAKRRKKEKRKAKKDGTSAESDKQPGEEGQPAGVEDDMAKMMGFAGFGSSKA